ncbi:hypothetical protein [Acetonema longum]|uniref:Uncharacterized protein n=1 Tax=Acetonema longum DSM 6540 TaxID=1009370 RepID=F7NE94_9FIRM|nr:hypothetical protein [Acetonema longum]EGO65606.1 hypothetical protein ALO_01784 [Acetonema longum DSM 6540]
MSEQQWIETACWAVALLAVPAATAGLVWLIGKTLGKSGQSDS